MSLTDRLAPLCDLLLGAAYADKQFKPREREEVREMLADLSGGTLPPDLETRISTFDPASFDLTTTARAFASDTADERRRLLFLVAAVNDADDEVDFSEDEYLRDLASALSLSTDALKGLTIEMELEEKRETFQKIRKGPPPPPGAKKLASIDVDLD
jgi:uncharacterized tellurite resistance protein B-like protein